MFTNLKKFFTNEQGNVAILAAVALSGMLMMTGLVIDGGSIFMTKSHLQKTANAAALSGAQELPTSSEMVRQIVDDILATHEETASLQSVIIEDQTLKIVLEKDVPLYFSAIFGIESMPVQVDAKAGLQVMSGTTGVVPLGIEDALPLKHGQNYTLKVGAGQSEQGFFGILELYKNGGKGYYEALMDGYDEPIRIGDKLNTLSGNKNNGSGAIQYRMDQCPYPEGEYYHRDCERVMPIVIYKWANAKQDQVEVTGFAYFYVTGYGNKGEINGIFIKRAGTGTYGSIGGKTPVERGAYIVTLME